MVVFILLLSLILKHKAKTTRSVVTNFACFFVFVFV